MVVDTIAPRAISLRSRPAEMARSSQARTELVAVLVWVLLVSVALWWGQQAVAGRALGVDAPPLVGRWSWRAGRGLIPAIAVAGLVVSVGPRLALRARWRAVPVVAGLAASTWALSLAASDGWQRVTAPLTTRHEYEPFARSIEDPLDFLDHFVERLPSTPVHVQGHPPGAPLVPWALDVLGLGGAGWFALLAIAGWGVAVGATLVAARCIAGEGAARRVAPTVVLLPAALWAGTSADALFAGVLAVAVALTVAARHPASALRGAALGGVVLGLGLLLTYGAVAVAAVPCVVLARQRRWQALALVTMASVSVLLMVAAATGFSWLDGLGATRIAYHDGVASQRPAPYFALAGNPAALALAVGPAFAAALPALVRRRREASSMLPLAALAGILIANLSLLSKGEVERIWLPFVPWLALAAPGHRRGWLAAQAMLAVALQAGLRSKW